jgi:hypothetical protein
VAVINEDYEGYVKKRLKRSFKRSFNALVAPV